MAMLFLSLLALSADARSVAENSMLPIENGDCSYFCNPVCDFKTTSFKDCKCCFLFFENCDHDRCHNYNPIDKPLEFGKGVSTILEQGRRLKQSCKVTTPLAIDIANVKDNNLHGLGPKTGRERIQYAKVGKSANNKFFDLIVETASSDYVTYNAANNGASGKVGRINVATKVSSTNKYAKDKFKFTFVDSDTGAPVVLEQFVVRFFDLDRDEKLTLHESICLDLDQINPLGDTAIPNLQYSTQDKKYVTSSTVNKDVRTKYELKTCSGASSSTGSVKVTGEKVGFACDNPTSEAFKTIECTDAKCFGQGICDRKRGKYFPINQANRALLVEMNDRSSFDAHFELECLKSVGETCTRNFEFTVTYLDSSSCPTTTTTTTTTTPKPTTTTTTTTTTTAGYAYDSYYQPYSPYEEPCGAGPVKFLQFDDHHLVQNNLGGIGPDSGAEEMRFQKVGTTLDGTQFDVVVKAKDTLDKYFSFSPEKHNIAGGTGFQVNLGVTAKSGKPITTTEFEISFQDQKGKPVEIDRLQFYMMDLDRDAKTTLREGGCYNLDELDLENTAIPGFDSKSKTLKAEPVLPGFEGPQLRTTYAKDKNCDGSSSKLGSVTVEANQVGFICDNSNDLQLADFKTIQCDSQGCFPAAQCAPTKKGRFFGLVDKDGKTCKAGTAGCEFGAGIHPATRLSSTAYTKVSSFHVSLGIECLKKDKETCTRNFVFRASTQNVKECGCQEKIGPISRVNMGLSNLVSNNIGGLGPTSGAKEMRFKNAGTARDGTEFDFVVKALETEDKYYSFSAKDNNKPAGKGLQINLGVTAKKGKPVTMTEFELSFEDKDGKPVVLDAIDIYTLDFDRDAKTTLRERVCYNLDSLDLENTAIPGFDSKNKVLKALPVLPGFAGPQLLTSYNKDKHCDGTPSKVGGSVTVDSNQVGFGCDNSLDLDIQDLKPVKCTDAGCFNAAQCAQAKKGQFFGQNGINPATRFVKTRYVSTSSFRLSLGVECLKPEGQTCTRNFVFRANYQNIKTCKCTEELGEVKKFLIHKNNMVANNIGGLGPTTGAQEMRFKKAVTDGDGKEVDLVFKALGTQDKYFSFSPKEHNAPAGRGFQVNIGVTPTDSKKVFDTEFEISFEDQQGKRVELDAVDIYLLDLDRDAKTTLRERACYDLDTLDLEGSDIPGFDSKNKVLKPRPITAGFEGTQLRTTYNKDKKCDGSSQTKDGSVLVDANQVGFLCDNSLHLEKEDFKPVKCTDAGCFTAAQCAPTKKKKFFGLIDKDGKTCKAGDAGCEFESGIHPLERLIATRYLKKSSIRVSLGIECLKGAGKTCTRNFVFRADYQNIKKKCPCLEQKRTEFKIDASTIAVNNLGGLGPDKQKAKEIRYKNVGQNKDGRYFDLVVSVAPGQTYVSNFAEIRNGLSAAGSSLGNINIDVDVTNSNNGLGITKFLFAIQDSLTGDELVLEQFEFQFFDFDVNKKQTLHELVCMDLDQFDAKSSSLPSNNQVKLLQSDTKDCAGKASQSGSVRLEGHGVGFLCDNPKTSDHVEDYPCSKCFTEAQCAKESVKKFFPIQRSLRMAKFSFKQRSSFSISLGVSCEKSVGENCNRNFIFTAFHNACTKK